MSDYADKTKAELLEEAQKRNLEGRSSLDKDGLVAALEADDAKSADDSESDGEVTDAVDLLTPSNAAEDGSEAVADGDEVTEDGELVGPTVTDEDQENFDKVGEVGDEYQDLVDTRLATHGPLTIENPENRIMTGAVNEEQAKEQEAIFAELPDGFVGDLPEKPSAAWLDEIKEYHKKQSEQN